MNALPNMSISLESVYSEIKPSILIVDDLQDNCVVLERILKQLDVELCCVNSGEQALSLLIKKEFALAIIDVQMPEMDGFELAELIGGNEATAKLPVIFVTAINKAEEHIFRGYSAGAVDYLCKPFEPAHLLAKVKVFLQLYKDRVVLQRSQEQLATLVEKLKKTEGKLLESNKDLEQFAYVSSHDLRAPLRGVARLVEWIEEDNAGKLDEPTTKHFNQLKTRVQLMDNLITGILEYSKINSEQVELEEVAVGELITNVIELLNIPENCQITVSEAMPRLKIPLVQFNQLFINLISNAIKYSDKDNIRISISINEMAEYFQFSISDNGPGIKPEFFNKVFQIFQTLHSKYELESVGVESTGIGLTTCKKIVEKYGGQIWLDSEIDKGTIFHFTWPKMCRLDGRD